jgi:hypothetical protein
MGRGSRREHNKKDGAHSSGIQEAAQQLSPWRTPCMAQHTGGMAWHDTTRDTHLRAHSRP